MAEGRTLAKTVKDYLMLKQRVQPRRGRQRSPESIQKRLAQIEEQMSLVGPIRRVALAQERIDLTHELNRLQGETMPRDLEDAFVNAVGRLSELKGLSYEAWREVGVSPTLLRRAGMRRSQL